VRVLNLSLDGVSWTLATPIVDLLQSDLNLSTEEIVALITIDRDSDLYVAHHLVRAIHQRVRKGRHFFRRYLRGKYCLFCQEDLPPGPRFSGDNLSIIFSPCCWLPAHRSCIPAYFEMSRVYNCPICSTYIYITNGLDALASSTEGEHLDVTLQRRHFRAMNPRPPKSYFASVAQ
jgi:hypothetical protein